MKFFEPTIGLDKRVLINQHNTKFKILNNNILTFLIRMFYKVNV